jgi:uncharacterized membrane protein
LRRDSTGEEKNLKKSFITGLVILLPTALTLIIAVFLFNLFTRPFVPIVEAILSQFSFPLSRDMTLLLSRLIALIFLFIFILLLGMIARLFLFTALANVTNYILFRIPIVNTIYKTSRDILSAIFSPDGKHAFKEAVAIPFPAHPHMCVGLSSGEVPIECEEKAGEPLISVFAPTAPHPISGFLFLVPAQDVQSLNMTKEDAIKFLLSCGVIHPAAEKPDVT